MGARVQRVGGKEGVTGVGGGKGVERDVVARHGFAHTSGRLGAVSIKVRERRVS